MEQKEKAVHIVENKGLEEVTAKYAVIAGDPGRIKDIANRFAYYPQLFTDVRGELGYHCSTAENNGKSIIAQSHGIGRGSIGIYTYELIHFNGVEYLFRLGTCGALDEKMKVGDLVIPTIAFSDAGIVNYMFYNNDYGYGVRPDEALFSKAIQHAEKMNQPVHQCPILSTDYFYPRKGQEDNLEKYIMHKIGAVEMESDVLFEVAAQHNAKALTILTVSDNIITKDTMNHEQRSSCGEQMFNLAKSIIESL